MLKVAEELETVLCAEIPGDLRTCRPSPNKHGVLLVCGEETRAAPPASAKSPLARWSSAGLSSGLLFATTTARV